MLSVEKQYATGSVVTWRTDDGVRTGTIEAVHKTPVNRDVDREAVALDASAHDPAYEIIATNGKKVFKLHSQVLKIDPP